MHNTPDLFAPPPADAEAALALDQFAEQAYLAYAMSVVRSRALAQVEDGMKPVQRRILFAMQQMRLAADNRHVKSARVVGDVIGKYHPHGDSSVYDAMVRVAQDFSLRYPLIDGQGNFGSRDGDPAAAMRYTECRLTPISALLLDELDLGTVDFIANYDGAFEEPRLLPARLPFVLLNGASGIAVGMATEIPPHNLNEVADALCLLIENPQATLDDVLTCLPAPDYPGGGQIISAPATLREIYTSGRGSLRMRAQWHIEALARGQWRVVIDALPHGVSTATVLSEIESATNPQARANRKELSSEQKNLRQLLLAQIDTVRDESSEEAPVRIIIEPRSSRQSRDEFINTLLAHTSLETSCPVNLTMIGLDGRPQQKGLMQILSEWIDFRYHTVERRSRERLKRVESRLHILDGRMIAFLHIEEVIRVIRESDEPRAALIARFELSTEQADDILEIRLRQLARLEGIRIEEESKRLRAERDELRALLEQRALMTQCIMAEIRADASRHGDARRSLVEAVSAVSAAEISVNDEPVTVIISANGWVRTRQGHGVAPDSIHYKTGDSARCLIETRTIHPLLVLDHQGRAYTIKIADLPGGRGDGAPITTFVDFQDGGRFAHALSGEGDQQWLFYHSGGYGFLAPLSAAVSRQRGGKAFVTLEKGETLHAPTPARGSLLVAVSSQPRVLVFARSEMKVQSGGRGLILIKLNEDEKLLCAALPADDAALTLQGKLRGRNSSLVFSAEKRQQLCQRRARRGSAPEKNITPLAFVDN